MEMPRDNKSIATGTRILYDSFAARDFKVSKAKKGCSRGLSRPPLKETLSETRQWEGGLARSCRPAQMAENLSAGVRVRLHSLQAAAQHNGVDGNLLEWNASTGRWDVKLSTGQELSVRPANLMPLADSLPWKKHYIGDRAFFRKTGKNPVTGQAWSYAEKEASIRLWPPSVAVILEAKDESAVANRAWFEKRWRLVQDALAQLEGDLRSFYTRHNGARLADVGQIAREHVGREQALNEKLRAAYQTDLNAQRRAAEYERQREAAEVLAAEDERQRKTKGAEDAKRKADRQEAEAKRKQEEEAKRLRNSGWRSQFLRADARRHEAACGEAGMSSNSTTASAARRGGGVVIEQVGEESLDPTAQESAADMSARIHEPSMPGCLKGCVNPLKGMHHKKCPNNPNRDERAFIAAARQGQFPQHAYLSQN